MGRHFLIMAKKKKLTDKQEMFCQEYLKDLNATQAAIRAGYSQKTAAEAGYENLRKPQIQDRIAELKKSRMTRLEIDQNKVLQEVYNVAMARVSDIATIETESTIQVGLEGETVSVETDVVRFKPTEEWPEEVKAAVASLGMSKNGIIMRFHDKGAHLEKLMKHLGLYEEDNAQKQPTQITARVIGGRVDAVTDEDDIDEDI